MTDRRTLLKILGVGAGLTGAGTFGVLTLADDQESSPSDNKYPVQREIRRTYQAQADRYPEFDFDYDSVEISTNDPYFTRVIGETDSRQSGDRLRLVSDRLAASSFAALLRDFWTVGTDVTVSTTISDQPISLRGGDCTEYSFAALVGPFQSDDEQNYVLAVRGRTVEIAKRLADNLTPPGSSI